MHGSKVPSKGQFSPDSRQLYELVENEVTNLFKAFLDIVAQISEDEDGAIEKLSGLLPEDAISTGCADDIRRLMKGLKVIDENKYKQLRRRVLSVGNDTIRTIMLTVYDDFQVRYRPKTEFVLESPGAGRARRNDNRR